MELTDEQKGLITDSFAKVVPISDKVAKLFYERLFEIAPDTKQLFEQSDMKVQGRKLMQTLATAVGALYTLDQLVPVIKDLGKRHIEYGVTKDQYDQVGDALIWALEQRLGAEFTDEVRDTWTVVYNILASIAITAYDEEK